MTLLLSETDVQGLLSTDECIAALEEAYRDLVSGEGQNIPRGRIRFAAKNKGEASYLFNCIPGDREKVRVPFTVVSPAAKLDRYPVLKTLIQSLAVFRAT